MSDEHPLSLEETSILIYCLLKHHFDILGVGEF